LRPVIYGRELLHTWITLRLALARLQNPATLRRAVRRVIPQAANAGAPRGGQLLVDVSVLARHDAGTGVQRATKELLNEISRAPPDGYVVRTVRASRWRSYRYLGGLNASSKVRARPGDIFLGLDLSSRILPRHRLQLLRWQATGVRLCVVMHDLLPLLNPTWFTRRNARAYRAWIHTVAVHADSVVCVSRYVAEHFKIWLADHGFDRESAPQIGWFHHGARLPSASGTASTDLNLAQIAQRSFILMVGTVEPRKGYAMVLDAFDVIWRDGSAMQLVIVGRVGWKVPALITRLRTHAEAGRRLHWFDNASDDTLDALYEAATGVLVASEGEGFGLPILEAALRSKPLLVRNLPVFHEIAGGGATYFPASVASHFVEELRDWLARLANGTAVPSTSIVIQSWAQSAKQMLLHALPLHRSVGSCGPDRAM
jgi:glycosyltransferase involved in cell wall biosynthesis